MLLRSTPSLPPLAGLLLLCSLVPRAGWAQEPATPGVRVFLDCDAEACDFDYVRQEIPYVGYVRDPQQADVHVFITEQQTGGNGRQYQLTFMGRAAYESVEYTFERFTHPDATDAEERSAITEAIRLGLTPYALQTLPPEDFGVTYVGAMQDASAQQPPDDRWRNWVFTAYVGAIELDLESNRQVFDSRWGLFADHVTEEWKLRIRPYFNYDYVRIEREGRPDVTSDITRHGLESYALRSLGPHWSAGVFGDYVTRNDENLRHRGILSPSVEYSVLPYAEATRRAFTFVYQLNVIYADYFERTIFGKTDEWLVQQQLTASVAVQQPWGEVFAGLEGSHFLQDFSKRRAEFFSFLSVRLFEGLSVRFEGSFDMIQDQIALPSGDATLEEILLQQRELATDFELSLGIALTYRFGSEFANIVNTRFD